MVWTTATRPEKSGRQLFGADDPRGQRYFRSLLDVRCNYDNYAGPKTKLIVPGAGHAESYYKDTAAYERRWIHYGGYFKMMRTRKGHKVYPLTVAQKFHFFYLDFCPKKEVMNIGTSLTIATDIDWEVLKQSIYKAYERSEACGSGSAKIKRGNCYQYIADKRSVTSNWWIFRTRPKRKLRQ